VTVVLDGQGADEVLGGYPYHQRLLLLDRLRHGRLGDARRELSAIGRREREPAAAVGRAGAAAAALAAAPPPALAGGERRVPARRAGAARARRSRARPVGPEPPALLGRQVG
jgi:hypothetical protein